MNRRIQISRPFSRPQRSRERAVIFPAEFCHGKETPFRLEAAPWLDTGSRMKTAHLTRFTFVGMLALMLGACASMPTMPGGKNQLAGTWKNSLGTVWTLKADSTFTADVHHGKMHAAGNYKISGDTITITETGAKVPQVCKGDGVYHFHRDGAKLHLTVVSDECKVRKADVTKEWTAVK